MANIGGSIGGLLQGFNQTYWPAMRQNEAMALQRAQEERAKAMQDFQMQKFAESEAKDRQAAGLYAGMLGIKPTSTTQRTEDEIYADANAAGDFMGVPTTTEQADPQYEQFLAGGAKAGADMVKMTREQQLAELKARSDAWKEQNAARLADLKDKQIMAAMANGDKRFSQALALLAAKDQSKKEMVDYKDEKKKQEPLSPEQAAKVGMVNTAFYEVEKAEKSMFDDKGQLNSSFIAQSKIPGTEAAGMRQQMRRGIEAALRIASGAAVPESEVDRYEGMYIPSWYDNKDVAKQKIDGLKSFYRDTLSRSKTGGKATFLDVPAAPTQPRVRTYNPQTGRLE